MIALFMSWLSVATTIVALLLAYRALRRTLDRRRVSKLIDAIAARYGIERRVFAFLAKEWDVTFAHRILWLVQVLELCERGDIDPPEAVQRLRFPHLEPRLPPARVVRR